MLPPSFFSRVASVRPASRRSPYRARISKRTFYHRFDDKAALFAAVLHRVIDGLRPPPAMRPLIAGRGSARVSCVELAGLTSSAVLTPQALALHRLIVGESARFPKLAAAVIVRRRDAVKPSG